MYILKINENAEKYKSKVQISVSRCKISSNIKVMLLPENWREKLPILAERTMSSPITEFLQTFEVW